MALDQSTIEARVDAGFKRANFITDLGIRPTA